METLCSRDAFQAPEWRPSVLQAGEEGVDQQDIQGKKMGKDNLRMDLGSQGYLLW